MSSVEKVVDVKRLSVKYSSLLGGSLVLLIREHWSAKKNKKEEELKSSSFFLKSVTNLFLGCSGGLIGIFYHSERF